MCEPSIMCRQHLLGEHNECHMFLGSLKKKIKLDGYFRNDLFEPLSLKIRHDSLAEELIKRGFSHNSELIIDPLEIFSHLTIQQINHKIDQERSLNLLLLRCNRCHINYQSRRMINI